jgi:hypothetical protein
MDMFNHALKQLPRVVELPPEQQAPFLWNLGPQLFGTRSWGPKPNRVVNEIAKLLDAPKFAARALAMRLLTEVVTGNHRTVIDYGLDLDDAVLAKRFDNPDAQAAYKAALKLAPKLSAELNAEEPATRSAAAFALAFLPGAAGKSAEHLRKRLDVERDPLVASSLLVALGLSCRYAKLPWDVPEPAPDAAIEQRAAWCCGQAYASAHEDATPSEARRAATLFADLTSRPSCEEERFPFDEGNLDCLLARSVGRRGAGALEAMTNALADAVVRLGKAQEPARRATAWTMTTMNLLWRQAEDLPGGLSELTPLQRQVLEKLSEHDTPAPFHGFGLPARCWERRRWLGLATATAFDMDVEDEDGQKRSVRELLARWNAGGLQRRKQAYEYLRERLTLQQFAEVLGEAAFGAGSIGSPPDDAYYACLDALSAKDADWAERYAVQLWGRLDWDTSVPERQRITARSSLLVLKPILETLPEGESLPDKWARLVRLGSHRGVELTRRLLERLPADQRKRLFASHLEDQEGWSVTLLLLSPYLDFFPSIELIDRFLELSALAVKEENRGRARSAVEALQGLAASNHPRAAEVAQRLEAWRKARKAALAKMDL